jgi:hypothetical protein
MGQIRTDFLNSIFKSAFRNLKFAILTGAMLFALGSPVEAQQSGKVPRIGYVSGSGDPNNPGPPVEAFRQGLRDLGYIEGKTYWLSIAMLRGCETVSQAS